jgi:hypothetical protein
MLFKRAQITSMGAEMPARTRQGAGEVSNLSISTVATDASVTMTVDQMTGGVVLYSGFTAGRVITTPTAALILAAATDMDIGDSFSFTVSITPAFAGTWAAGVGVTLAGRSTVPASSSSYVVVTKTSATTVIWTGL